MLILPILVELLDHAVVAYRQRVPLRVLIWVHEAV